MFKLSQANILERKADLSNIPEGKKLINTINAYSYNMALKDELFAEALNKGDALIPDGGSIVWTCHLIKSLSNPQERCAGWDLFAYEMNKLNTEKKTPCCHLLTSIQARVFRRRQQGYGRCHQRS